MEISNLCCSLKTCIECVVGIKLMLIRMHRVYGNRNSGMSRKAHPF